MKQQPYEYNFNEQVRFHPSSKVLEKAKPYEADKNTERIHFHSRNQARIPLHEQRDREFEKTFMNNHADLFRTLSITQGLFKELLGSFMSLHPDANIQQGYKTNLEMIERKSLEDLNRALHNFSQNVLENNKSRNQFSFHSSNGELYFGSMYKEIRNTVINVTVGDWKYIIYMTEKEMYRMEIFAENEVQNIKIPSPHKTANVHAFFEKYPMYYQMLQNLCGELENYYKQDKPLIIKKPLARDIASAFGTQAVEPPLP